MKAQFTFAVFAATLFAVSANALSGNGSVGSAGYQGRLQTVEIPGAQGKEISLEDLDKSFDGCMTGNESGWASNFPDNDGVDQMPKINSLAQKIADLVGLEHIDQDTNTGNHIQIGRDSNYKPMAKSGVYPFHGTVSYQAPENREGYASFNLNEVNWAHAGKVWVDCSARYATNCTYNDTDTENFFLPKGRTKLKSDRIAIEVEPSFQKTDEMRTIVLISKKKLILPYFSYSKIVQNSEFDSMGRNIPGQKMVTDVALKVPEEMNNPVTFVNAQTNQPTQVVVDFNDFVSCLKTEVQKHLK